MALTPNTAVVHLPFGERPAYGSPYPEGLAVAHIDVTGDASAGGITGIVQADRGFLYRLELMNVTKDDEVGNSVSVISSSNYLTDRSGLGTAAFDLNWQTIRVNNQGFQLFQLESTVWRQIRKQIIGRTDAGSLQTIWTFVIETNTLADVWDMDLIFTYWRKESLAQPGFLSSFLEAPVVPSTVPLG